MTDKTLLKQDVGLQQGVSKNGVPFEVKGGDPNCDHPEKCWSFGLTSFKALCTKCGGYVYALEDRS